MDQHAIFKSATSLINCIHKDRLGLDVEQLKVANILNIINNFYYGIRPEHSKKYHLENHRNNAKMRYPNSPLICLVFYDDVSLFDSVLLLISRYMLSRTVVKPHCLKLVRNSQVCLGLTCYISLFPSTLPKSNRFIFFHVISINSLSSMRACKFISFYVILFHFLNVVILFNTT